MGDPVPTVWPNALMIRDTGLHDDMGGGGQRIYTTAGRGYEKRRYVLDEWQLIATAPKFSNVPIISATESYVLIAHWDIFNKCWSTSSSGFGDRFECQPTHWRPMPTLPNPRGEV